MDASGNSYVVWGSYGDTSDIYWVKINPHGVPGDVIKISTHPDNIGGYEYFPQIAVDASGNSYVVWDGFSSNGYHIYWVKISTHGVPGNVVKVSTHPDNIQGKYNRLPRIAVDTSGNSYVVWNGRDDLNDEIYWVKVTTTGVPGNVLKVSDRPDDEWGFETFPQIATNAAGTSYIVWESHDYAHDDLCWVNISTDGVPGNILRIPCSPAITGFYWPRIALDAMDNTLVAFSGSDWSGCHVYWVKITADGVPSGIVDISTHPASTGRWNYFAMIAVDNSGISHIVWSGWDGSGHDIYWAQVDGGVAGPALKISTHPDNIYGNESAVQVDAAARTAYVVWRGSDGHGSEIYWVELSSGTGDVQKISTHPDNINFNDNAPQIAVDARGNSSVVWSGWNGTNDEIYFTTTSAVTTEGPAVTPENLNTQMRPLAQYNIVRAEELSRICHDMLAEQYSTDASDYDELLKADEYLAMAKKYFAGGNYIAANYFALKAIEAYNNINGISSAHDLRRISGNLLT